MAGLLGRREQQKGQDCTQNKLEENGVMATE